MNENMRPKGPPLEPKDFEFFDLSTKRGSNLPKSSGNVAFRTTERFQWALEIYKRFLNPAATDSMILEHCLWEALRKENPIVNQYDGRRYRDKHQERLTKIFYTGKDQAGNDQYKYISVVELSWSSFQIFRTIKLFIAEPRLLKDFEKEIIDFIKEEDEFWYGETRDFKKGTLKAHSLYKTFEKEKTTRHQVVKTYDENDNPQDIDEEIDKDSVYNKLDKEDLEYNLKDIDVDPSTEDEIELEQNVLSYDRFDLDYMFSHEGSDNSHFVVANFALEIKRLTDLVDKYCRV